MVEYWLTVAATELKKKRAFRKFSYRGVDLDQYVRPSVAGFRNGAPRTLRTAR